MLVCRFFVRGIRKAIVKDPIPAEIKPYLTTPSFASQLLSAKSAADPHLPIFQTNIASATAQQLSPLAQQVLHISNGNAREIVKFNIQKALSLFQRNPLDTGSAEAQIAVATVRILYLTAHVTQFKKDHQSKRKLVQYVQYRNRLLEYIKKRSLERYFSLLEKLNLAFPGTDPAGHLMKQLYTSPEFKGVALKDLKGEVRAKFGLVNKLIADRKYQPPSISVLNRTLKVHKRAKFMVEECAQQQQ